MAYYLTVGDLRRHFGRSVGRDKIYALIRSGHLKSAIINGRRVVLASELERFDRVIATGNVTLKDTSGKVIIERTHP